MTILVQLGAHYFACGVPGHCSKGMRAKIEVAAACSGNIWEIKLFNIWVLQLKHLYLSVFVSFMCICLFVCLCIFHCHHRMLNLYSCNVFYLCIIQSIGACGLKRENLWRKCTECSSSSSLAGRRKHLFPPDLQQAVGANWNSSIFCLDNFYQNFS